MNYIIFDLEATCWDGWDKSQNETIEIGAVLINEKKEIISEFSRFVKPLNHPILSEFCKELTTIDQNDVDSADYFQNVISEFKNWVKKGNQDYILCSWGYYDRKQFESDCDIYGIDKQWIEKHISLKHQYGKFKKLKRSIGMKNALISENIPMTGTHHRGIDDARNIAKIFVKYFDQWDFKVKS
ncbi:MAG: 3'-5' exonuclease [Nonlabens sp.]